MKKHFLFSFILVLVMTIPALGATFTKAKNNKLFDLSVYGDAKQVTSVLKTGVNINARDDEGLTALMLASRFNDSSVVKTLINAGANVNMKGGNFGRTALMWASTFNSVETVQALLKAGADVNIKDD